jgi:hypothetical protein
MHVIPLRIRSGAMCFDQDTYSAPANESFAFEITNSAFTLSGEAIRATVVISWSEDPARAPMPGRPWMWEYSADRVIVRALPVEAGETKTVPVPALEPGDYVVQVEQGWDTQSNAALIVR